MQPYVIRQGDHLDKLAYQFGFDATATWNADENASLRALRASPDILFPGDVLYYTPGPNPPAASMAPGSTNNFTANVPTVGISVQFGASDSSTYASQAYTLTELPQLTGLQTDANGLATFDVPATLDSITLTFTSTGEVFSLQIGGMDPINTLSGIFGRLQNLGFIDQSVTFDPTNLDRLRTALIAMKLANGAPSSQPPASQPPASQPPASQPPASQPPASQPPASQPPASQPPASQPPASQPPASQPPPSGPLTLPPPPPPSGPPPSTPGDNGGLSDDGTLDPDVAAMLVKAYGC